MSEHDEKAMEMAVYAARAIDRVVGKAGGWNNTGNDDIATAIISTIGKRLAELLQMESELLLTADGKRITPETDLWLPEDVRDGNDVPVDIGWLAANVDTFKNPCR